MYWNTWNYGDENASPATLKHKKQSRAIQVMNLCTIHLHKNSETVLSITMYAGIGICHIVAGNFIMIMTTQEIWYNDKVHFMQTIKECQHTMELKLQFFWGTKVCNFLNCVCLLGASTSSNVIGKQPSSVFLKLNLLFLLRIFNSHLGEAHDSESK